MILKKGMWFKEIVTNFHLMTGFENPRAQKWLIQSRKNNNPAFALLNAWTELEFQIKSYSLKMYRKAVVKSRFMIDECADILNLTESEISRLFEIRNLRNGISHGLVDRSDPNWADVYFLLNIVKNYRIKMNKLSEKITTEEE